MITHCEVWRAIDLLVAHNGLSISVLARQAGLDRTAFATSKRLRDVGPCWPSTESLSRILQITDSNMLQFSALLHSHAGQGAGLRIPIIGLAQAGRPGYFDDPGFPVASGWDMADFLYLGDSNAYALEICGE